MKYQKHAINNAISEAEEEYEAIGILLDARELNSKFMGRHESVVLLGFGDR